MRHNLNLDELFVQAQGGTGFATPIAGITVRRNDTLAYQIGACLTGVAANVDLGTAVVADVRLIVKPSTGNQRFDGPSVLKCTSFAKVTIDGQIYYSASVPISGDQIDLDLGVGAPADVPSKEYLAQVSVSYLGGRQTSRSFSFTIENNFDRGEAPPAPAVLDGGDADSDFDGTGLDGGGA